MSTVKPFSKETMSNLVTIMIKAVRDTLDVRDGFMIKYHLELLKYMVGRQTKFALGVL